MFKVDNAIIMAAGVSSRFAPLSYEKPKALTVVKGEILIERQIRQLRAAGIEEIYVVVGYKAEQFAYLQEKFNVHLIMNHAYMTRNNNGSIYAAKDVIRNSYICSADNYFAENPFEAQVDDSYYAAVFAQGETQEWCMQTDDKGYISQVHVGGCDAWYMLGHAFWSEEFSAGFLEFRAAQYDLPQTKNLFWENIFMEHLDVLKMRMRKYTD
jgi:CTP:phosphocholine cytidylyltransferase-like protein